MMNNPSFHPCKVHGTKNSCLFLPPRGSLSQFFQLSVHCGPSCAANTEPSGHPQRKALRRGKGLHRKMPQWAQKSQGTGRFGKENHGKPTGNSDILDQKPSFASDFPANPCVEHSRFKLRAGLKPDGRSDGLSFRDQQ